MDRKIFAILAAVFMIAACQKNEEPAPCRPATIEELDAVVSDGTATDDQLLQFARLVVDGLKDIVPDSPSVELEVLYDEGIYSAKPFTVSYTVTPDEMAERIANCARFVHFDLKCGSGASCTVVPVSLTSSGKRLTAGIPADRLCKEMLEGGEKASMTLVMDAGGSSFEAIPSNVIPTGVIVIDGTLIRKECNLYGCIRDKKTGKGIPGVAVTDGYGYVTTDEAGVYQMTADARCRKVYYSTPAGYKVALNESNHTPLFFSTAAPDLAAGSRNDFVLEPLDNPEENFTMVMIGDPQCKSNEHSKRYVGETIPDIVSTLSTAQASGKYLNSYAFTLGDITFDSSSMWIEMRNSMSNIKVGGNYLPFFQCIGNHDHNSIVKTNDYDATQKFMDVFGPTDYSLNRGKAHVVVMDDILVTSVKENSSPNKATWNYNGGFTDAQVRWLEKDLSLVEDKEDKLVVLCMHIPFRGGSSSGGSNINTNKNYNEVLSLLTQFKEAHVMIGHTHYPQNYIHKSFVCKGGQPIYEHVHGAACGAWWSCNSNTDGAPNGFSLYEVEGSHIRNWVAKGTGLDASKQLRVYDGNQVYTGKARYSYRWYQNSYGGDNILCAGSPYLKDCLVAEIWNDDDTNWSVVMMKDGVKVADMTRIATGTCANAAATSYFFNDLGKNKSSYAVSENSHYWYFKPDTAPADYTGWEVVATQKIPGEGNVVNTYRCSSLTTDYSEF